MTEFDLRERFIPKTIYRHFKGGIYASMFLSKATDSEELIESANENFFMTATHTETGGNIIIFIDKEGNYMHSSHEHSDDLAIYVSLENGTKYCRPIDMFVEEVDREKYPIDKYPEYSQPYRLMALEEFEILSKQIANKIENRKCVFLHDEEAVVIFGEGKVVISTGKARDRKGEDIPAIGFTELEEATYVGCKDFENRNILDGQVMMAFKNEASVDAVLESVLKIKETFKEECTNVETSEDK